MGNYYPSLVLRLLLLGLPLGTFAQFTIPSCAVTCYNNALTISGCATDDLACQCGPASESTTVQNSLTTCLAASCSTDDIMNYTNWAIGICSDVLASSVSSFLASLTAPFSTATSSTRALKTSAITVPTGAATTRAGIATGIATVATTPTAASSTSAAKENQINLGLIIGSVVGGLVVAGLLVIAIIFCCWRRSKSRAAKRAQLPQPQNEFQSTQNPMLYEVLPMLEKEEPTMARTPSPIPPQNLVAVPGGRYNAPTTNTVEMEGEDRKSFVEIEGTEKVTREGPHRRAELASNYYNGFERDKDMPR